MVWLLAYLFDIRYILRTSLLYYVPKSTLRLPNITLPFSKWLTSWHICLRQLHVSVTDPFSFKVHIMTFRWWCRTNFLLYFFFIFCSHNWIFIFITKINRYFLCLADLLFSPSLQSVSTKWRHFQRSVSRTTYVKIYEFVERFSNFTTIALCFYYNVTSFRSMCIKTILLSLYLHSFFKKIYSHGLISYYMEENFGLNGARQFILLDCLWKLS